MKKNWSGRFLWAILFLLLLPTSCNKDYAHAEHSEEYTCPMHPTVTSDQPGACPVCGMDLVKKVRSGEEVEITGDLSRLLKSPSQSVVSSIKTVRASFKAVVMSVKAVGVITYDTRNIYTVPTRVGGRIEKMFLKYEFQKVRKGEKIAEIYSPELITAQSELMYLIKHDSTNSVLIEAVSRRLELLGVQPALQEELIKQGHPANVFTVYSPYDGYMIVDNSATSQALTSNSSMSGMGSYTTAATSAPGPVDISIVGAASPLREGSYIGAGQQLVKLVNTEALRIELDLPAEKAGMVQVGDMIELHLGNDKIEVASVDFVQPYMNEEQNFIKLRVYIRNIKDVYIGQLVHADIHLTTKESLWVPKGAVLYLGNDQIVFIKDRDLLNPRRVQTGIETMDEIEVLSGLSTSDEIAVSAQYLIDSESFIKPVEQHE